MSEKQIVHALDGGRTPCNFMPGLAANDWPEDHKWMALEAYGCSPGFDPEVIRSMGGEPCPHCVDALEGQTG